MATAAGGDRRAVSGNAGRTRSHGSRPEVAVINGGQVIRIVSLAGDRCQCPEELEHLQEVPADRDDSVAVLRWALAWRMDFESADAIARHARVDVGRLLAFMRSPAMVAGQLITFAEAARLLRVVEERLEDRELADEYRDMRAIAEPYLEVAGLDYGKALRRARKVRSAHRAANRNASRCGKT